MISEQHNKLFTHFWFVACPEKDERKSTHQNTLVNIACMHARTHSHKLEQNTYEFMHHTYYSKISLPQWMCYNFQFQWELMRIRFYFGLFFFLCKKSHHHLIEREWTNKILLNKINLNLIIIYPSLELWELWVREWVTEWLNECEYDCMCMWFGSYVMQKFNMIFVYTKRTARESCLLAYDYSLSLSSRLCPFFRLCFLFVSHSLVHFCSHSLARSLGRARPMYHFCTVCLIVLCLCICLCFTVLRRFYEWNTVFGISKT